MKIKRKGLSPSQAILLGCVALILVGAGLLLLPISSRSGRSAGFSTALFTSTSAACVTGLVVRDTATSWSGFGQAVILLLIQIGGLGVITAAAFIALLTGRRLGLRQRSTLQEAFSAPQVGGIVGLSGFVVRMTAVFELAGALALLPTFLELYGLRRGVWVSVFTSVSAFCNAGLDLSGAETPFSSMTAFAGSVSVNLTLMLLIILGGIGFLCWDDIRRNGFRVSRWRTQTKLVLTVTGLLILLPALWFYFFEFSGRKPGERILASLFQSVTPRTAGFNTADQAKLSESGQGLTILLMLIGGSPGSTAGGIKTTTFAVLLATAASVFRRRQNVHFFGRRIPEEIVRRAATLAVLYFTLSFTGAFIISRIEALPLLTSLFETASAVGTVGLTLGVTPGLGQISRGILIVLMIIGRVGGLTLIFSALKPGKAAKYPQETLTVG